MSIFNKAGGDHAMARQENAPADTGLSVIGAGMKVVGDLESNGVVKVDGVVEGCVRGANQLLLGKTGEIHGDIYAEEVVLAGSVVGKVVAAQRAEIQSTCNVQGDIQTKSIVVLEGGVINGTVRMEASSARPTASVPRSTLALSQ